MSVLQMRHNEAKLIKSENCNNEEYVVASREVSRLSKSFVQYWVNTGNLPSQFCKDTAIHSDTGSSLSEEGSACNDHAICNSILKYKLNGKQLCNNSSSNSSVDTAAYVLSNTNVTKKENIYPRFFIKDRILKIHKDTNYKNNKIDAVNMYDTIDPTISNKKCAFDICRSNETYNRDKELEEESGTEEFELKLPGSSNEECNATCENDKQVNEDDVNVQNEEYVKNSTEQMDNITSGNTNNSFAEDLNSSTIKQLRQKKLYVGRESPIDIDMPIISESMTAIVSEEKRNLHPAYRNSPLLQKPHRKFMPKKRKYKIFLKNSSSKSQEDTSSNNSDSIDVGTRHTKRHKFVDDFESQLNETHFLPNCQTSGKDKLRESCKEMEKQIKRFTSSEFMNINELKQLNHDRTSQGNTKNNLKNEYNVRSKIQKREKVTQEEINTRTVSSNTLNKKHNPIILLERLSENLIMRYINKKDLKSKETTKKSIPIKKMIRGRNKRNYGKRSLISKNTKPLPQLENIITDSGNSTASTMIVYNHVDSQSTNRHNSNDAASTSSSMPSSNSHNAEKNKSDKLSSDIKLIQMRPVVVLERLRTIELSKKECLSILNNLKNKLQPTVVLEPLININNNSVYNINALKYNEFNKSNESTKESRKTNKRMVHNYGHSKKLLYFKTNTNSDSDSDVSSPKCIFNLNTYMKNNTQDKMTNQSFGSLKNNMPEDLKCTEKKKTICDSIARMSTNNEDSFLGKVSCINRIDNQLRNFSKRSNNQKVNALASIQLKNETSAKDKDILENNVETIVNINASKKNKRNKWIFVTKAYDSDSD